MESPGDQLQCGSVRPGSDLDRPQPPKLYSLLSRLRGALLDRFDAKAVWQLRAQVEQQSRLLRQAEAALTRAEIFERASVPARMGIWQCDLPSERLTWSRGTYDLFGRDYRSGIIRRDIITRYSEESLARLEKVRSQAIATGTGFLLDAEIHPARSEKRWIRICASVERRNGEPVRLFGTKQDITEEKHLLEHMRYLAEHDVMTGLANRAQFETRFSEICGGETSGVLMLIDLDGFKDINDKFGHAIGDECLVEISRRLSTLCQFADLIARIGGDEFAVLIDRPFSRQRMESIAQLIIGAAAIPITCSGHTFQVGASIGYAFTEGEAPRAVFARADRALYAAKAAGRRNCREASRVA